VKALLILSQWIKANKVMLTNAASLIGTTGITSAIGFGYWWVAARGFPPQALGIASAALSVMSLLGMFCALGLGTLLITELPRQPGREGSLISTALLLVGGVGVVVGVAFALAAPYVSAQFLPLRASIFDILIFGLGVSQTAITLVLDQALIGLLRGHIQMWRNTLFAVSKLGLLFAVSLWVARATGMSIYATWTIGGILSLLALVLFVLCKKSAAQKLCATMGFAQEAWPTRVAASPLKPCPASTLDAVACAGDGSAFSRDERLVLCIVDDCKRGLSCAECLDNRSSRHERRAALHTRKKSTFNTEPRVPGFRVCQHRAARGHKANTRLVWRKLCGTGGVEYALSRIRGLSFGNQGTLHLYLSYSRSCHASYVEHDTWWGA